ncbi:MAG: RNA pseudouridine synthase [Myxococcota bacterium]
MDADSLPVIYRDEDLVVVDKPPGLPSDRTRDPQRSTAVSLVQRLGEGWEEVRAAHRLDKDTSGVLVLARHRAAAAWFGRLLQERKVEKVYRAVAIAPPSVDETLTLRGRLQHERGRTQQVRSGGQLAITDVRVIRRRGKLAFLEVRPRSGRTHQIRVQLADAGMPIQGDPLYGGAPGPRLMLHALRLTFEYEGRSYHFEAPPPEGF